MSILVIDVGTSGVRAAVVHPDGAVDAVHHRAVPPTSPMPGLVEFDAAAMADAALDVRHRGAGRGRAGRRRRHHQPAGVDDRVGPRDRRARRARRRVAGPAHRRQCLVLQAQGSAWPQRVGHQAGRSCSTWPTPTAPATCCFGTVDTWIAWHLSERLASTSPTPPTPPSPGCSTHDGVGLGPRGARRRCASRASVLPDRSSTPPASSATATALAGRAAHRRDRRRPAGLARGPGLRRPAWPRSRSAPAACSTCASAPTRPAFEHRGAAGCFPIVAWRRGGERRVGRRGGDAVGRHQRRVAARRPRHDRSTRPSPTTSPRQCDDHRRRGLRAGPARAWARRTGTTAPGARCSGSPAARAGPRSCGPCSRASPTAAPTWSRRPRPTAAGRSRRCASTAA